MKPVSDVEIGKRIQTIRKKTKMTQQELSKRTDISTTVISSYENGKRNIGLQSLAKIAIALKCTMDELFFGSKESRPINSSCNIGELIVNCLYALYENRVVGIITKEYEGGFVPGFSQYIDTIGFVEHQDILKDMIDKLEDFESNKEDYPDPESFKKQILAYSSSRINKNLKSKH